MSAFFVAFISCSGQLLSTAKDPHWSSLWNEAGKLSKSCTML